ncbi:hypothetical protein EX30DRAFT_329197 [Ascodesmis nigricans]|uniref:Peroxin 8 n=1 Tax=Ascodesmis nigricans TaxID=341454 RepID=A0A4S2N2H1_9PEZI|nr:hypothetical protein EX30DRAFT_329197 [Ascodesmis nigricans]
MVVDRRLDNVLRSLLQPGAANPNSAEGSRIYASAATVLATLTNPLNVSLLSTQILTAPAIWENPDGLRASLRTFGVFQSATLGKIETPGVILGVEDWMNAVVRGANRNVPRWKHLLLLGAILSADHERSHLPRATRNSLEDAFCRAVNLSLSANISHRDDGLEADVLSMVLSHAISSLSRRAKAQLNYHDLLPFVVKSIYYSKEGFQSGYFLPTIDHDIVEVDGKLSWPSRSNSFLILQERTARPLFVQMGSLARLTGQAIKETHEPKAVHALLDDLGKFSQTMQAQWKLNRLSTIPFVEEENMVDSECLKATMPVAWQMLKTVLFTTTIILQEMMARVIETPELCEPENGPSIASKTLNILRNFYFITSRINPAGFSSYNFVYYTSIDILTSLVSPASPFPEPIQSLVTSLSSSTPGTIPPTHSEQLLDLFFLNLLEHLVPHLPADYIESTVIPILSPYLQPSSNRSLHLHFESSHTAMLSVLASPHCAELATKTLPFYVGSIFTAFPSSLSARQFRIAYTTLIRECSPPQKIAALHPNMVDVLLELLKQRAVTASTEALSSEVDEGAVGLSERDVVVLAMVDSLPVMNVDVLERWLQVVGEMVASIADVAARARVRERFWDVLSGELDVSRAEVAVKWWGNGGREVVVEGGEQKMEKIRPRL